MALIAVAAAICFTVEKVRDHKEKKHALKAQETPQCDLPNPVSIIDDTTAHHSMENLPPYHEEALPSYHKKSLSPYPFDRPTSHAQDQQAKRWLTRWSYF
jgi:hypothetical protein